MAPVTVPELPAPLPPAAPDPPGADRLSDAALDVTEPPGCVAIDVSDEFAALPCMEYGTWLTFSDLSYTI